MAWETCNISSNNDSSCLCRPLNQTRNNNYSLHHLPVSYRARPCILFFTSAKCIRMNHTIHVSLESLASVTTHTYSIGITVNVLYMYIHVCDCLGCAVLLCLVCLPLLAQFTILELQLMCCTCTCMCTSYRR